jgi:hypothetical protein
MKTRTTILALALAVTSFSALAPNSASAWGMQSGYGGAHFGGGYHFGGQLGGRTMSYFRPMYRPHLWAPAPWRPAYRPYVTYSTPTYAPAPVATYQRPYLPVQPVEEPCENAAPQY